VVKAHEQTAEAFLLKAEGGKRPLMSQGWPLTLAHSLAHFMGPTLFIGDVGRKFQKNSPSFFYLKPFESSHLKDVVGFYYFFFGFPTTSHKFCSFQAEVGRGFFRFKWLSWLCGFSVHGP